MIASRAARGSITALQYTANFANGGHANIVAGESIQVAGQNSYTLYDMANTGMDSGLDKTFSNFVAGEMIQPTSAPISLLSKQQFDSSTFQLDRFDAIAKATLAGVTGSVDYALYAAQPALGWEYPREGLTGNASYKFQDRWTVNGSLVARHVAPLLRRSRAGDAGLLSRGLFVWGSATRTSAPPSRSRYSSSTSAPGRLYELRGRPAHLPSGDAQPDPDVPTRPAHAWRRQGERRPVTARPLRPELS